MGRPTIVDWQRVVLDLRSAGWSAARSARHVGAAPKHLQNLARGDVRQPRFDVGVRLLDLHLDVCPERHVRERLWREEQA